MNISVLGAGAWGTAIACLLRGEEHSITLWGASAERLERLRRTRENDAHLPGIRIPADLSLTSDFSEAIGGADLVVAAIPSEAFRGVCSNLKEFAGPIVSLTKGIEYGTGLTMSGVVREVS